MHKDQAEAIEFYTPVYTLEGTPTEPKIYKWYVISKWAPNEHSNFIMLGLIMDKQLNKQNATGKSCQSVHLSRIDCLKAHIADWEERVKSSKAALKRTKEYLDEAKERLAEEIERPKDE